MESEKCFGVSPARSSSSGKSPILKTGVLGGDPVLEAQGGHGERRFWKQMHNQVPEVSGGEVSGGGSGSKGTDHSGALLRGAGKKAGIV